MSPAPVRRILAVSGCLISATALVAAVTAPAASAAPSAPKNRVLTLERVSQDNVDLGAAGPSTGDVRATRGVVRDARGKRVGSYATSQVTVASGLEGAREQRSVIMEVDLPGGQVDIVGIYVAPAGAPPSGTIVHVIVGGTGAFFGARGTLTLKPVSPTTYRATFHFA